MTRKKVVKILVIISVVILIFGIILGISASNGIANEIQTQGKNGGEFQQVIGFFGQIGAEIIGFVIICYSIFIDIMIWVIYGVIILLKKIIDKLN